MSKNIIVFLFLVLAFSNFCFASNKKQSKSNNCCTIAYIDMEVLLKQYNRIIDFAEKKRKRQEENIVTINNRKTSFDEAIKEFQQKIESNAFSSADYADREHKRLMKMESDLAKLSVELQQAIEQEDVTEQDYIQKLIKKATEEYNESAKFQFILTKRGIDNIIIANSEYDITMYILDILNTEYAAQKKNSN